ncbi:hypothetical protein [Massilia sp. TS11]|uniref:hypothetical protein n=1 Tax=Massilia sp. TS11 TaxID=2908003 RepID=UPI001EDA8301|nr:hypothetical protein [Massilia sp. TS11]MCG2584236.1 hypothetical protein [Massilia sp. TS11]
MATFGRDCPTERPDIGGRGGVFVPNGALVEEKLALLKNGAGCVGFGNIDGSLMIYFEANKFDDSSLHKWEDKCFKAYERMVKRAPTVNKMSAEPDQFTQVGIIEGTEILVKDWAALREWLESSRVPDAMPESEHIVMTAPHLRG